MITSATDAPHWAQREPFRILFPIGILCAWVGVGQWLMFGLGLSPSYASIPHAIIQVQGFLTAFVLGFLFTAIPRRMQTPPPSFSQLSVAALAPLVVTGAAVTESFVLAEAAWIAAAMSFVWFGITRVRGARRAPPVTFLWIPVGFLYGVTGSAILIWVMTHPFASSWLHALGRSLLLQGFILSLVVGVGGMVVPLIVYKDPPPDMTALPSPRRAAALHGLAMKGLALTFLVETFYSLPIALALRGLVCGALLIIGTRLWRLPNVAGWHRKLIWIATWAIPIGYIAASILPHAVKGALHIVFIAGLALITLAVSAHVSLAHGGREDLVHAPLRAAALIGVGIGGAVACRLLVDLDPIHFNRWLALGSAAFLCASFAWLALILQIKRPT